MRETVTVGPLGAFVTNRNREMALKAHAHFVEVTLTFEHHAGSHGYPSFRLTNDEARLRLRELTEKPIEGTNEAVARKLFDEFASWKPAAGPRWTPCNNYELRRLSYAVRGVDDRIGHDDGFTVYTVERDD